MSIVTNLLSAKTKTNVGKIVGPNPPSPIAYQSDFTADADGWTGFACNVGDVDTVGGFDDVLKVEVSSSGDSRRAEKIISSLLVNGESYDFSFDVFIPMSNIAGTSIRLTATGLGAGVTTPTRNTWTAVSMTSQTANTANPIRIYISTGATLTGQIAGEVFYLKNILITKAA